ncbi:hypothetical protein HY839_01750 [Candidatus Azambacteria bacterium]|nr:hypothetical protein [Candidatus Azambacteria bacterium]
MQNISQEQIIKRYFLLSKPLQDALFSERTSSAVGRASVLRDAEPHVTKIAMLTGRVLLGYLRPETFAFEIQKETGIDALKATQVAHDIDTEIFSEVRLELKKLYPPTIQTPTVQAPGFLKPETRNVKPEIQDSGFTIQEKPRYVVPIPERFKKTTPIPPPTQEPKQEAPPIPVSAPAPSPSQVSAGNLGGQAPQPPKIQEPASPPMDPIVPLPTFIQSKFTNNTDLETRNVKPETQSPQHETRNTNLETRNLKPETQDSGFRIQDSGAPIQDSSKNDALKNAFGKFTMPSTATGIKKEPESPYREPIEEPKKAGEQKPTAKVQGKVIDLSRF